MPGARKCVLGVVACAAFGFALFIAITGGVTTYIGGIRFASHRVVPALTLGWVAFLSMGPDVARALLTQMGSFLEGHDQKVGLALATCTSTVAFLGGAFTAAGADPYGYVSQAGLWASGSAVEFQRALALDAPWANAVRSFCPLGYLPGSDPLLIAPAYPPGLPLQMAVAITLLGPHGAYVIVPLLGGLAVWLTFVLGRRVSGPTCGLAAALLLACSPVFLFQLMQPMSDVPVTAWWLLAVFAASSGSIAGAGGAASLAILTRPNLVPLAVPLCAYACAVADSRKRLIAGVTFVVALVPGVVFSAAIQTALYGSPFRSGYGGLREIFDVTNVLANVVRYPVWAVETYSPFIFLGLAAPMLRGTTEVLRRFNRFAVGFAAILFLCYAFYVPFDHWTYLRFLLPATPLLFVTALPMLETLFRRWERMRTIGFAILVSTLAIAYVHTAVRGDAFRLKRDWATRYRQTALLAAQRFPAHAAFISLLQSGSLRFYADRLTIRYDVLEPQSLPQVGTFLRKHGYDPYLALDGTELKDFQRRFGLVLNNPVAVFGDVRFYRAPGDIAEAARKPASDDAAAAPLSLRGRRRIR